MDFILYFIYERGKFLSFILGTYIFIDFFYFNGLHRNVQDYIIEDESYKRKLEMYK